MGRPEQREQPEQPQLYGEQGQQKELSSWSSFVPAQFRDLAGRHTTRGTAPQSAIKASRSKTTAFLAFAEGSDALDLSTPALAGLAGVGLAMMLVTATRRKERTVSPPTEVLG